MTTLGPYYLDHIYYGDCRDHGKNIPDNSIDCIFTDPPYIQKYMYLYDWLGEWGARVLKPGGFLMAYAGIYWKPDVMAALSKGLDYFWDFTSVNSGNSPVMWMRKVLSRTKSILCYSKPGPGPALPRCNVLSYWIGSGQDKRYHTWQQDESTARYYIDCFTHPGALVVDPFMGSGTTAYVCQQINRRYLGFELELDHCITARERLSNAQMPLVLALNTQLRLSA